MFAKRTDMPVARTGIIKRILTITTYCCLLFAVCCLLPSACMKEEKVKSKSMEELQSEKGLPIRIKKIALAEFETKLTFFAKLSGIKESTQGTNLSDYVKKVHAKVGDFVKEGKTIIEFPTDIPTLQYAQTKSALDNAEKLYKRMKELMDAGETAQQNLDNAKLNYDVSQRNFEAMKQMIKVEAPFSGTLINLYVKDGEIPPVANPGQPRPLFTVAQLDVIKATINVSEKEINFVKLGMPATIIYNGEEFTGRIAEISPAFDSKTHSFPVEVHFTNGHRKLKSGVTADLFIKVYTNPNAIVVPRNLITIEDSKSYIFVEKNGIAEKREIELGMEDGINVEVLKGLNEGENIINCCKTQLSDGIKINIIK
ncbi:MAG: efflux RND transporter periplasmic adaptor subunit [bacterium]